MFDTKPHGVTHSIMFASGTSNPGKFMQQHLCMNYGSSILPFDQGYISCVNDSVMLHCSSGARPLRRWRLRPRETTFLVIAATAASLDSVST